MDPAGIVMLGLPEGYPEVLASLARRVHAQLQPRLGADADAATLEIVEAIRREFGGEMIYIPMGAPHERQQRNATIYQQFNGRNHAELAHRHGVSVKTIYDVLSDQRARRQPRLFE